MVSKPPPTFREIAGDVRPLPPASHSVVPSARTGPDTPRNERVAEPLVVESHGECVVGFGPGVSRRMCERLARGDLKPQARLDGHGLTVAEMRHELAAWLASSRSAGRRTVLVVHGRGLHSGPAGPQLKEAVTEMLKDTLSHHVLAFSSAPPAWGGSGAMVVRLRRPLRRE